MRRKEKTMTQEKERLTFIECEDSKGRTCIRLDRTNGTILARYRDDLPGQMRGRYQWARERRAVERGYGSIAMDAIRLALYQHGQSDFCPQIMAPESCRYQYAYRIASVQISR